MENSSDENPYHRLTTVEKDTVNAFFERIVDKASIDYSNSELQDIESAVYEMLDRVKEKVNEHGIFNISRIQPCGSMAEKNSLWKLHRDSGDPYIECDYLAVTGNTDERLNTKCSRCLSFKESPINLEHVERYYKRKKGVMITIGDPRTIDDFFIRELTSCMTKSCNCLSVEYRNDGNGGFTDGILFTNKSPLTHTGCDMCTINKPTGILCVNTSVCVDRTCVAAMPAERCSLIFEWKSKAKSLFAPNSVYLLETKAVTNLSVYVDFLPAVKLLKYSKVPGYKHETFAVPKLCHLCDQKDSWRMSSCMAEINFVKNSLSYNHLKCYKIIKYLISTFMTHFNGFSGIDNYHIKTLVLHHGRACSVLCDDCIECVVKIFAELKYATENKDLKSFDLRTPLITSYHSNFYKLDGYFWSKHIDGLCPISKTGAVNLGLDVLDGAWSKFLDFLTNSVYA